jgi:hypothetical protein
MTALSDDRSFADEFMEEASKYLANLALLNTAYLGSMAGRTNEPLMTPDVPRSLGMLNPTQGGAYDSTFKGTAKGVTITIYEDGRRQYKCGYCGKLHDRRSRAEDCRNVDLGIRPYKCLGKCGKISWCVSSNP